MTVAFLNNPAKASMSATPSSSSTTQTRFSGAEADTARFSGQQEKAGAGNTKTSNEILTCAAVVCGALVLIPLAVVAIPLLLLKKGIGSIIKGAK